MAPNHHHSFLPIIFLTALFTVLNPTTAAADSPSPPSPPLQPPSPSPSQPPPPPPPPLPPSSPPPPSTPPPSPPPTQSSPPSSPPSPPSPPSRSTTPQQLTNIIGALIGAGDFGSWVNIITGGNQLALPLSATLFIPQNAAVDSLPATDPFMFPYHVVPQRLTFADLQLFKPNSRLPTLLPGKSILIANASASNFTLDGALLTQPDLYVTATVAVHGVGAVLEYSVYGDGLDLLPNQPPPSGALLPSGGAVGVGWRSDAAPPCHCVEFPVVWFSVGCAVLGFKIHRNYAW